MRSPILLNERPTSVGFLFFRTFPMNKTEHAAACDDADPRQDECDQPEGIREIRRELGWTMIESSRRFGRPLQSDDACNWL
jgi:hypothetical protein